MISKYIKLENMTKENILFSLFTKHAATLLLLLNFAHDKKSLLHI